MSTRRSLAKPAVRYHHGDLRSALIQMAWQVIERRGIDAFSLRAVADALGVSHAAPAHHFRDRDELLAALRLQAWTRFAGALETGGRGATPLRSMGLAYIDFALAHPRAVQLMFRASGDPPAPALREQAGRAWGALVGAVAAHIGPQRAAQPVQLNTLAVAAWAQVHGLAMLWTELTLPDGLPQGEAAGGVRAAALDVLLAGFDARAGAQASTPEAASARPGPAASRNRRARS